MYTPKFSKESFNRMHRAGTWILIAAGILTTMVVNEQPLLAKDKQTHCSSLNLVSPDSSSSPRKVIVGSWIETVTFSGGAMPPLKSLTIFSADGTVTVADQGNVNLAAGQLFSVGTGSWVAQGDRTFAWTVVELISDLNGNLMGTLKVRGVYTVDEPGNSYTGVFYAEVRDTSGNLLFSIDGTNAGQRIQVEPLP